MDTTIRGVYREGVIEPLDCLKLKDNTEVIITIPDKNKKASLKGMAKQLVSDKELENFMSKTKKELAKGI